MSSDFGSFVLSLSSRKKNGNLFVTNGVKGIWVVVHFSLSDGKKSIAKRNGSFIASQMQLNGIRSENTCVTTDFGELNMRPPFRFECGNNRSCGMIFSALFPVAAVVGILPLLPRA